jgi:hypothetical protein
MNVTSPFNYTALGGGFQFKNCSSAASILQYLRAEPKDLDNLALNTSTGTETEIYGYIVESLGKYLQDTSQQPPSLSEKFWSWAKDKAAGDVTSKVKSYIKHEYAMNSSSLCKTDLCRTFGWSGNPDLAGVGVRREIEVQVVAWHQLTRSNVGYIHCTGDSGYDLPPLDFSFPPRTQTK